MSEREPGWVKWVGILVLIMGIFALFFRVGEMPIYEWDEARLAANAQEMMAKGDLVVTYFNGEPDHWNTKPPLMIILEAASMSIFGQTTLAFRLPALIASLITLIYLSWLGRRITGSNWGLMAGGILGTMPGYIQHHAARTGDYDALLTLFLVLTLGHFLQYIFVDQKRTRWIWIGLFLTLATLTKGIASYFLLPGMALTGLFFFKIWKKHIWWILGVIIFHLVIVSGYYLLRESMDPGYLQAVWENELGGRFGSSIEQHKQPAFFYLNNFISHGSAIYFLLIPFWLFALWLERSYRKPLEVVTITLILFELIISSAGTKLFWYDVPAYPLIALGLTLAIHKLVKVEAIRPKWRKGFYGLIIFVSVFSFGRTLDVLSDHILKWKRIPAYAIPIYLKDHQEAIPKDVPVFAFYDGYSTQIRFYMNSLGYKRWINPDLWVLEDSGLVILSQSEVRERLEKDFQLTLVDSITDPNPVYLMQFQRKKN
ncbi:MAG: glycosyltransferase family 39 protein [Bacteroidota bacterium]|nr:glycosyltransferase family 39 protein [Bacteroidota bacterium]MDX5506436.1 glycosyltransferase family 39 protein [Bacteroidota bacterium]